MSAVFVWSAYWSGGRAGREEVSGGRQGGQVGEVTGKKKKEGALGVGVGGLEAFSSWFVVTGL